MNLTALPYRVFETKFDGTSIYSVWSSPLCATVFASIDSVRAYAFFKAFKQHIDSGMSHNAAVALIYSTMGR